MPKIDCTTPAPGLAVGGESLAAPASSGAGLCSPWKHVGEIVTKSIWPFMVAPSERVAHREGGPACGEGSRGAEALSKVPAGNHGDNLRSAQK